MRTTRLSVATALVAAGMYSTAANACDFTYDEVWKVWRGDCSLTIDKKGPLIAKHVVIGNTRLRFADLLVDKLKFRLFGNQLEISADIENAGAGNSPATTVALNVTIIDPATMSTNNYPMSAVVPALPTMTTQRIYVGTVTADHSMNDVDVMVNGMADPLTSAAPVRGVVFELIESNNSIMHLCRVYGPNPNVMVQPCN